MAHYIGFSRDKVPSGWGFLECKPCISDEIKVHFLPCCGLLLQAFLPFVEPRTRTQTRSSHRSKRNIHYKLLMLTFTARDDKDHYWRSTSFGLTALRCKNAGTWISSVPSPLGLCTVDKRENKEGGEIDHGSGLAKVNEEKIDNNEEWIRVVLFVTASEGAD